MPAPQHPATIGKFHIQRTLGKGAQGSVYLALDPDLNRRVAIKSLHFHTLLQDSDADPLFAEARTISGLQHPNIVTIHELGVDNKTPFMVLEYIDGASLKERIQDNLGFKDIIKIMSGVVSGVAGAHAKNIVHCDLKPANVLIDSNLNAKIADFGLANIPADNPDKTLYGTPRYMAPEYIESGQHNQVSDVFSLGLIFFEILTGKSAIEGTNIYQVLNTISNTDIPAPSTINPAVNQQLDILILRALNRDPQNRFANAGEMLRYFNEISLSTEETTQLPAVTGSTVQYIVRRIKQKKDFPAFAQSIDIVNAASNDGSENISTLSSTILKDISLTNKILKVVNSVNYNRSGVKISTVSRAIVILGLNELRRIATSIMLFDHVQDKTHSEQLKEQVVSSIFSAQIAHEVAAVNGMNDREEAYIGALLRSLGRLLVHFYLFDEAQSINLMVAQDRISENQAAKKVLGVDFLSIGMEIAQQWGFPEHIVQSIKPVVNAALPHRLDDPAKSLQLISQFSADLTAIIRLPFVEQPAQILAQVRRYAKPLRIDEADVSAILEKTTRNISEFSTIVKFDFMKFMYAGSSGFYQHTDSDDSANELSNGDNVDAPPQQADLKALASLQVLNEGIHEITYALTENTPVNEIFRMILETIYRSMSDYRVLIAVLDGKSKMIQSRTGYGENIDELLKAFSFRYGPDQDIFCLALKKNIEVLINDTADEKIRRSLPGWYSRQIKARSFAILPIRIRGIPLGLIYLDGDQSGTVQISTDQLSALKALRNQAILAINARRQ